MAFCHLTDILHKAFFGFLGRLGQYFIAVFADIETEKNISEPLNRILHYETMGAFCGALQNHLPVVAQSGSQTQTSSQAMSLSA